MSETLSNRCPRCGAYLGAAGQPGICPRCAAGFLQATETQLGGSPPFTPPSIEELAPRFPGLEILECIGQGGMGAVYKARQKDLGRIVALKVLPPRIGQEPAFADRFTREARALARLNHPGIVTLYEFGRADGLFFFLMEFVDGVNLRQLLSSGRVAPREALAIVPQICDALQYAHDEGIVHRDIKPENILLDRRGRVKVADFGLAKLMGRELLREGGASAPGEGALTPAPLPAAGEGGELTGAGKVMGTPQYMSPEQIQAPGEVDHRADIYALGVVFYQMLTGELPGKELAPPSSKVRIDVRLDEIVLRALEKDPERRYQQASVLKTQVETLGVGGQEKGSGEPAATAPKSLIWVARGFLFIGVLSFLNGLLSPINPLWPGLVGIPLGIGLMYRNDFARRAALGSLAVGIIAVALGTAWLIGRSCGVLGVPESALFFGYPISSDAGAVLLATLLIFNLILLPWMAKALLRLEVRQACSPPSTARKSALEWGSAIVLLILLLISVQHPLREILHPRRYHGVPVQQGLAADPSRWRLPESIEEYRTALNQPDFGMYFVDKSQAFPETRPDQRFQLHTAPVVGVSNLVGYYSGLVHKRILYGRSFLDRSGTVTNYGSQPKTAEEHVEWLRKSLVTLGVFIASLNASNYVLLTREDLNGLMNWWRRSATDAPTRSKSFSGAVTNVSFGPVVERVLPESTLGSGYALDLESGELLSPPTNVYLASLAIGVALDMVPMDWARRSGADLLAMRDGGIRFIEGLVVRQSDESHLTTWDQFTAEQVVRQIDQLLADKRVTKLGGDDRVYTASDRAPLAMAFLTREHSRGLIQIIGPSDNPRGVKIRYKLVRNANETGAAPVPPRVEPKPLSAPTSGANLEELQLRKRLLAYGKSRHGLSQRYADYIGFKVPSEVEDFFKTAETGDWPAVNEAYRHATNALYGLYHNSAQFALLFNVEDTWGAHQVVNTWPAERILAYGKKALAALAPDKILLARSGPGFYATALVNQTDGTIYYMIFNRDKFALGPYLVYRQWLNRNGPNTLDLKDGEAAFNDYLQDARRRYTHDTPFPNEPRQLKPGENVKVEGDRTQVSGEVALQAITDLLVKRLKEKNPNVVFVEEDPSLLAILNPNPQTAPSPAVPLDSFLPTLAQLGSDWVSNRLVVLNDPLVSPDVASNANEGPGWVKEATIAVAQPGAEAHAVYRYFLASSNSVLVYLNRYKTPEAVPQYRRGKLRVIDATHIITEGVGGVGYDINFRRGTYLVSVEGLGASTNQIEQLATAVDQNLTKRLNDSDDLQHLLNADRVIVSGGYKSILISGPQAREIVQLVTTARPIVDKNGKPRPVNVVFLTQVSFYEGTNFLGRIATYGGLFSAGSLLCYEFTDRAKARSLIDDPLLKAVEQNKPENRRTTVPQPTTTNLDTNQPTKISVPNAAASDVTRFLSFLAKPPVIREMVCKIHYTSKFTSVPGAERTSLYLARWESSNTFLLAERPVASGEPVSLTFQPDSITSVHGEEYWTLWARFGQNQLASGTNPSAPPIRVRVEGALVELSRLLNLGVLADAGWIEWQNAQPVPVRGAVKVESGKVRGIDYRKVNSGTDSKTYQFHARYVYVDEPGLRPTWLPRNIDVSIDSGDGEVPYFSIELLRVEFASGPLPAALFAPETYCDPKTMDRTVYGAEGKTVTIPRDAGIVTLGSGINSIGK